MKKAFTGLGVLIVFGLYSLLIRHQVPVLTKPAALAGTEANNNGKTTATGGSSPPSNSNTGQPSSQYKDGIFTGSVANAYYGNVQVKVTIAGGRITDVAFLQYPNSHGVSVIINQQAMPYLKQETLQAQNANVQIISGATFTSEAFIQSLQSALTQA